jgi:hypothetical protein
MSLSQQQKKVQSVRAADRLPFVQSRLAPFASLVNERDPLAQALPRSFFDVWSLPVESTIGRVGLRREDGETLGPSTAACRWTGLPP